MSSSGAQSAKAFSCTRCFERKVKCDRRSPCSNCLRFEADCIYRAPPAPNRRKKQPHEKYLLARLKDYESLLRSHGIGIENPIMPAKPPSSNVVDRNALLDHQGSASSMQTGSATEPFIISNSRQAGQLIIDQGKSRFVENNLWTSLSQEFRQPNEAIAEHSSNEDDISSLVEESSDFLLGYTPSNLSPSLHALHPGPERIAVLWQIYLDNINPLTMLIHPSSFQQTLHQAITNLQNLPRGLEALLFVIYGAAVHSIGNDECMTKLGEPRNTLLTRYRHAAGKAFARARFVSTSELIVLQAFILYLLTMRENHDSRTTWIFAGVGARIAQAIGIHVDGSDLGLFPFATEMRRRLWWQIAVIESRSAELTGSRRFSNVASSNVQLPTNVDDGDLWPDMPTTPTPQIRPTESIACLVRYEIIAFWEARIGEGSNPLSDHLPLSLPLATALQESDALINELEQQLEDKFLRYCDPSSPIQLLASVIGRAAINIFRLKAHHPRKYPKDMDVPDTELELLWSLCIKLLENDNLAHSSRQLQKFMWHSDVYFQWQAIIYLLGELRIHTLGPKVDHAWQQIEEVFHHHPKFITDCKKPLHVAVGSLCVKAFGARERALRNATSGSFPILIPGYIRQLRAQRGNGSLPASRMTPPVAATMSSAPEGSASAHAQPQILPNRGDLRFRFPAAPDWAPQDVFGPLHSDETFANTSDWTLADDLGMTDVPIDWAQWDSMIGDSSAQQ